MIRSIPTKAVTATPDTIQLPNKDAGGWSLRNDDGTYSIFYIDSRDYPDGAESAFAGASKAVLKALGGSELRPGEVVYLPNLRGTAALTVVCVTGGTASMDIESGEVLQGSTISGPINNLDYVLSAEYTATITATSIIPTAFTATLPANTVRIVLIPRGDMYWNVGAATASTALIGQGFALNMPVTKAVADTIQVYAAGAGFAVDLLVYVPR